MRILMVTEYAPYRDGIAAYALQTVKRLRREGHDVEVLSPAPSAAHHHLDLLSPRGGLALAKRVRAYDQVIVQYHPDFFHPLSSSHRARTLKNLSLAGALRRARFAEVRAHEADFVGAAKRTPTAKSAAVFWRSADRIVVHTPSEKDDFIRVFGVKPDRVEVAAHGADFVPATRLDRAAARARLGIPEDAFVFLAIGFIQPHKGFDRAIDAFATLGPGRHQLYVVGSVRVEEPEYLAHLEQLRAAASATPGVEVHDGYVSDETFDRWIVASDAVVLPYRTIWSSGVMERAALYDRTVIASRVGGLAEQAADRNVVLVDDDAALAAAMAQAAGVTPGTAAPRAPRTWELDGEVTRDKVMDAIRSRAAAHRSPGTPRDRAQRRTDRAAASALLRQLPPLTPPRPTSARPGVGMLKRLVHRLIDWQVAPVVHQVNQLQQATIQALEANGTTEDDTAGGAR